MKPLFEPEGLAAIEQVLASDPLVAFDFDGTLAPIVARPGDARVPRATAVRLRRLSQLRPVAVISGRQLEDLRARVDWASVAVVGLHGAEGLGWTPRPVDMAAMDALRHRLRDEHGPWHRCGVVIEDKGLSLTLHYRNARDRLAALDSIRPILESAAPTLRIFGGKCVVNFVPAEAPDKADAVQRLKSRFHRDSAIFVGDDDNDEPVFERAQPQDLTIRVGNDGGRSAARFYIDRQESVIELLDALIGPSATD